MNLDSVRLCRKCGKPLSARRRGRHEEHGRCHAGKR